MNLQEATTLITDQEISSLKYPTTWADLGCGSGLFSRALSHLLQPGSRIYAVDKKPVLIGPAANGTEIIPLTANFETDKLPFPALDGILMANSLHYVARKEQWLARMLQQYKNYPVFLIVEYDTLLANQWVPYPIDCAGLTKLVSTAGVSKIKQGGR